VLPKDTDAHKGSLGKALFISGSSKYFGAPFFNAFSFIKGGGGLSYLATTERVGNVVLSNAKEVGTASTDRIRKSYDLAKKP